MKSNLFKSQSFRYFLTTLLVFGFINVLNSGSVAFGQNSSDVNYSDIQKEWKLYQEKNGVQIYHKKADRNDKANGIFQELVLFKFVNTTTTKFEISWKSENWYDGKCWNCNKNTKEVISKVVLDAGENQEGETIRDSDYPQLRLFSKFLNYDDKPELTKFRFINLEVNPL